jgi:C1A family cysteine protease
MVFLSNLIVIVGGISSMLELNSTYMNDYVEYIQEYNKDFTYENFEIYKTNVKDIQRINSDDKYSFKVEVNQMTDQIYDIHPYIIQKPDEYYLIKDDIVPTSVDWRDNNAVTDIKNQGKCGSCWAFSTTGSIEGIVSIKENKLYNISEQQLVDCSTKNNGCEGGSMDQGFQYVINNGLCSEKNYSYEGVDDVCRSDSCQSVVNISSYRDIYPSEVFLKRAVAQQPVSVAIQANLISFQHYKSGIYNDDECGSKLDHGVLVVGYGIDSNTSTEYWIVKNSWGKDWGENGYIRIQKDTNKEYGICGISKIPSIPVL